MTSATFKHFYCQLIGTTFLPAINIKLPPINNKRMIIFVFFYGTDNLIQANTSTLNPFYLHEFPISNFELLMNCFFFLFLP